MHFPVVEMTPVTSGLPKNRSNSVTLVTTTKTQSGPNT